MELWLRLLLLLDRVLWLLLHLGGGAHLEEDLPELVGHLSTLGLQLLDLLLLLVCAVKLVKVVLVLRLLLFLRRNILRHGTRF